MRHILVVLALLLGTGCASNLSTLQTARPLARGQLHVSVGAGAFVPLGQIAEVVDIGIDQSDNLLDAADSGEPVQISVEEQQRMLTAGIALAVAPPGGLTEFMIRAGVLDNFDVGLRYSGISLRLDGKYRFFHRGGGEEVPELRRRSFDMALGVGVARHFFKSPALDLLKLVEIDDFSRYDVEVPLYLSADYGDIFKLYAAPKYVYSRTSMDQKLIALAEEGSGGSGGQVLLPSRVHSHFAGSTVGFAVGYKYVHFYAELTGGYTFCRPLVLGEQRNLGGVTFYPAVGVAYRSAAGRP